MQSMLSIRKVGAFGDQGRLIRIQNTSYRRWREGGSPFGEYQIDDLPAQFEELALLYSNGSAQPSENMQGAPASDVVAVSSGIVGEPA